MVTKPWFVSKSNDHTLALIRRDDESWGGHVMKRIFYYHVNTIDIIGIIIGHVIMISEAYVYDYYKVPMDSWSPYKPI